VADYLNPAAWLAALVQTALFVAAAPLFTIWVKRVKCTLQNRRPPPWLQPYRDLRRLLGKEVLLAHTASPVFRVAPYIVCGTAILAASIIPFVFVENPLAAMADAIVLVATLALGRFFLALAGMDIGTSSSTVRGAIVSSVGAWLKSWTKIRIVRCVVARPSFALTTTS